MRLTYLSDVHIPTWGTFVTTSQQSAENARVSIDLAINNVSDQEQSVYVITDLIDASGTVVASQQSATVALDDSITLHQEIALDSPHLWSLDEPYRYEALHKVYADGKETDQYATPFGIREVAYSKDGFYLNGEKVFLKGVNIHHDAGPEGSAVSDWTMYRRLKTLKEMGCNAIRLSHNPHSPVLMNMCDTMGILLVAEAFDKWEVNTYI